MKGFIATNPPFIFSYKAIPFDKLKEWLLWRINSHGKLDVTLNGSLMKLWNINGIEINESKGLKLYRSEFTGIDSYTFELFLVFPETITEEIINLMSLFQDLFYLTNLLKNANRLQIAKNAYPTCTIES